MSKEKKELERIENKKRTWKSKIARQMDIWEEIADGINSNTGRKQEYWIRVMELYHLKY